MKRASQNGTFYRPPARAVALNQHAIEAMLALGLEKRFGIQVPAMLLNEGPTIERVTARILERLTTDSVEGESNDLATTAQGMVAQHGEAVSQEVIDAALADIEMKRADV